MKALYYQDGREPLEMVVLATNADKTVNLGYEEGGAVVVDSCTVADAVAAGFCTLVSASSGAPAKAVAKFTKDDLLKIAAERGLTVDPKATKDQIALLLDADTDAKREEEKKALEGKTSGSENDPPPDD